MRNVSETEATTPPSLPTMPTPQPWQCTSGLCTGMWKKADAEICQACRQSRYKRELTPRTVALIEEEAGINPGTTALSLEQQQTREYYQQQRQQRLAKEEQQRKKGGGKKK